jgi:hypothetical protein
VLKIKISGDIMSAETKKNVFKILKAQVDIIKENGEQVSCFQPNPIQSEAVYRLGPIQLTSKIFDCNINETVSYVGHIVYDISYEDGEVSINNFNPQIFGMLSGSIALSINL